MRYRDYDPKKDKKAIRRVHREVGWLDEDEKREKAADLMLGCGRALVAEADGEAECVATSAPATFRYLERELSFSAVTTVATSRVARRQGLASRLTARLVAADAADGALVAGLGMFDQGFYNRLGFGSGGYEHWVSFDPALLKVDVRARVPRRITADDWEVVHASRLARARGHGGLSIAPAGFTRSEMLSARGGFGLGYFDGDSGELTHHVWCTAKETERGPYGIMWTSYRTADQFLDLMALLHSLGDQVRLVRMREPPAIQLQDLIERPFRQRQVSKKSRFESSSHAVAYWQVRMCDVAGCLALTGLPCDDLRFNLVLDDPIARFLADAEGVTWRGVAGEYVVTLGASSSAKRGSDGSLPTLTASVGAFTRMWLGVRPAGGLAMTDDLAGPPELIERLDRALCLPDPKPDWDF